MLLRLEDIYFTFGNDKLLEGADLSVYREDRIALVGRNGSGKSTLMKIAARIVEPGDGEIFVQPKTTIGYLEQMPDLSAYTNIKSYVEEGLVLTEDLHRAHYYMQMLGLKENDAPSILSGGAQRRAALAKILAKDYDVLLLDEPTNHLDIVTIEWLEETLKSLRASLVIISHDRRFLENLTNKTVWLDRGRTFTKKQSFSQFEDWRDKILQEEEEAQHKLARQISREEHWLRYGVSARRKRNMKRLADLQALRISQKEYKPSQGRVLLEIDQAQETGRKVIEARHLNKSYGDKILVKDFSIMIHRGERVAFVGPNGSGKTSLLNMLIKQLAPDSGTVKLGTHLDLGIIDQKRALEPEETLMHYLTDGRGETLVVHGIERHVSSYMKDFLFLPQQARTKIKELSGGERARLILARILSRSSNFLVLDEPTNDLDAETLDVLQEMLARFPGTLLLVSHDRDFLDRTATRIVAPNGDGTWVCYAGGYSDMLAQRKAQEAQKKAQAKSIAEKQKIEKTATGSSSARTRKLSFHQKYALEKLPEEIKILEEKITTLEQLLAKNDLYNEDRTKFLQSVQDLEAARKELGEKEEAWLELEVLREELENSEKGSDS